MTTPRVISAAAGSGKTTRLVRAYLELLADGIPAEAIIAITFTRAAGAELVERVSQCLRAGLGDAAARDELGPVFDEVYAPALPPDDRVKRAALRGLMSAPVGTTDSFVRTLLSEFALEAALPVDDTRTAPVDLDGGTPGSADALRAALRDVVDPPAGPLPAASARSLEHQTLGGLLDTVTPLATALPGPLLDNATLLEEARTRAEAALRGAIGDGFKTAGKAPGHELVEAWRAGGGVDPLPAAAVAWCAARIKPKPARADVRWIELLAEQPALDLGVAQVSAADLVRAFSGWGEHTTREAADTLRTDLVTLARAGAPAALRAAAASGALDYALLNRAAIHLCAHAPDALRGRFQALLVDEAQDASPDQMALYRALMELPGEGGRLRTTYVGDPRQSIYLFRGAEPRIFDAIRDEAVAGGTHESLDVNRRATPALNDAQRALFQRVEDAGLRGVDSIAGVRALPHNARKQLAADHPFDAPVVLVVPAPDAEWSTANAVEATVDVLLRRLDAARAEPGHGEDTAAVLAPTWSKARVACGRIRALRGMDAAHIEGNKGLFQTRVARDVAVWLRALWDGGDALSWAAVWRHPMVGISDAGLIRLKDGRGLLDADGAPMAAFGLGSVVRAHALDPAVHDAVDVATFARVTPTLRSAVARLGREGSAGVLDAVFAALRWRVLLRVGPDGDEDVARLEVLLDLVRQAEQAGVDPDAALRALAGTDGGDAPKVHLDRGPTSIACTTIFQAKGLAWDHVGVVAIGGRSDGGRPSTRQRVRWRGAEAELVGVKLDPSGALHPIDDPVARVAKAAAVARGDEERLRCAYVALTRARRSVTVGLNPAGRVDGIHTDLAACWLEGPLAGVHVEPTPTPTPAVAAVHGHVLPRGALTVSPAVPEGRAVVSPSSLHDHLDPDERTARLDAVLDGALLHMGLPALPLSAAVRGLRPDVRGSLVHGWLGEGGLAPATATEDAARAFLARVRPDLSAATFVPWLLAVSARIEQTWPGALADLRSEAATHAFELPVLAPETRGPDAARLLNGSIDLLVQRPDGTVDIVDFKGEQAPAALTDLRSQTTFRENVLQVDAYRRALQASGLRVGRCCLLYTATGTWVTWPAPSTPAPGPGAGP